MSTSPSSRVMRDAMLRRSEAAALTWSDVECVPDGTGRLTVRRSKADQAGPGRRAPHRLRHDGGAGARSPGVSGSREPGVRRPRRARHRRPHPQGGPRRRPRGRLLGHSPRVGMARDLAASGTTALMMAGRRRSERMPALYARGELARRGPVARYYRGA